MKLENTFEVAAAPERAWAFLLDPELVVPCMPGAALLEVVDEDNWKAQAKVKLGPVTMTFKGAVGMLERDDDDHRVVLEAKGTETRGKGRFKATITSSLEPAGEGSRISVVTELKLSGKAATFGRGMVGDVSERLTQQFAKSMASQLQVIAEMEAAAPPQAAEEEPDAGADASPEQQTQTPQPDAGADASPEQQTQTPQPDEGADASPEPPPAADADAAPDAGVEASGDAGADESIEAADADVAAVKAEATSDVKAKKVRSKAKAKAKAKARAKAKGIAKAKANASTQGKAKTGAGRRQGSKKKVKATGKRRKIRKLAKPPPPKTEAVGGVGLLVWALWRAIARFFKRLFGGS